MPTKLADSLSRRKFGSGHFVGLFGNRCAYPGDASRIAGGPSNGHTQIRKMQDRCIAFHDDKTGRLFIGRQRQRNKHRGTYHDRIPRGERREAMGICARWGLHKMAIKNCRVTNYQTGEPFSIDEWSTGTGMSRDRVKAALADLVTCGHMRREQERYINAQGQLRARIALTWFTAGFFESLGAVKFLRRAKGKGHARPRKGNDRRWQPGPGTNYAYQLAASKAAPAPPSEYQAKLRSIMFEIGRAHPDWPPAAVEAAARDRLR